MIKDCRFNHQFYFNFLGILCAIFLMPALAAAALGLNVRPVGGGRDMHFGKIGTPSSQNKEIRFRITSDENTQYQIFQRIIEPFANERGEVLGRQVILSSSIQGSNGSGTLYLQGAERLGFTDQLIYTSSQLGDSDNFKIVYKINEFELTQSGNFFGRILYTIRPVRGTSLDEVIFNVFFGTSGEFTVDSKTSTGTNSLRLEGDRQPFEDEYVEISFDENLGNEVRIYQELAEDLVNDSYEKLEPGLLIFTITGENEENFYIQNTAGFQKKRELLYESKEHDDRIKVHFELDDEQLAGYKAGNYNGIIRYIVETKQLERVVDVRVSVEIQPTFKLVIEYPDGGVSFQKLLPHLPPQVREMVVKVQTNLGKPYAVSQVIRDPLANEKGNEFDHRFFMIKQILVEGSSGTIQFPEYEPVSLDDSSLFYSDEEGSSAEFKVIYKLIPYGNMKAGTYKSQVVYSLGEI